MNEKYQHILNNPHFSSQDHPRMPRANRAAQFAPFAALSGYSEAIFEEGRLMEKRIELDEYEAEFIAEKLSEIATGYSVKMCIVYFVEDRLKSGGSYEKSTGFVKSIDRDQRRIYMNDNTVIPIDDIVVIEEI